MANVGLDFGTHQTKVCMELGEDVTSLTYKFFAFKDLKGEEQYVLPSVIQINTDNTLSYGFVDETRCKYGRKRPVPLFEEVEPKEPTLILPKKPVRKTPNIQERNALAAALSRAIVDQQYEKAYENEMQSWEEKCIPFRKAHIKAMEKFHADKLEYEKRLANWKLIKDSADGAMVFRNFKQASFLEPEDYPWPYEYKPEILSVWYLTFILYQLDAYFAEHFNGDTYTIQMGAPTGRARLLGQQKKAVRLIVSAFKLMEKFESYDEFSQATVDTLYSKTELVSYLDLRAYEEDKYYYGVKVFPEAYAGLSVLTSKGSLTAGFGLIVDIGGGTTDISFFAVNSFSRMPIIYHYDSVPKGLNYILEQAMPETWDKMSYRPEWDDPNLDSQKKEQAIDIYFNHVRKSNVDLQCRVYKEGANTTLTKSFLNKALYKRPVIYSGGGSPIDDLFQEVEPAFTDKKRLDVRQWNGLYVDDIKQIGKLGLCPILNVALGLAISHDDDNIEMPSIENLFSAHKKEEVGIYDYGHDKDLQSL